MKCKDCKRRFNESHREDNNTVYVQTLCIVCQGLHRENNYRRAKGFALTQREQVYDTENRFQPLSRELYF